ncbi:hypothetical protein INR77_09600 [Erythrobacter sp. SCSIO 43205]|uniref:hypothetical protein n=1 Tax=Erythrobacter sp. SCSIO 43205 TaxID=2779361 RepID=UPI001CA92082|nr:hypothetical protein [Erythrobacter sp. SCSIO 43205]UAB77087.1 hypothetical protein INR77_09600 [Erythrobacter sp. SCSIO 43205]
MIRISAAAIFLVSLTGCHILFPEDPRMGSESVAACVSRLQQDLRLELAQVDSEPETEWVPTYTYDITKVAFDDIQELIVRGSDETAGARGKAATSATSAAVERFMAMRVDENGAFFFANDPALYRVRGEPTFFADVLPTGCERQRANMRMIAVDFAPVPAVSENPSDPTDTDLSIESE